MVKATAIRVKIAQQTIRHISRGFPCTSPMPWAISTLKGLMVEPIYPTWLARKRVSMAVIESNPIVSMNVMKMMNRGISSSLMP